MEKSNLKNMNNLIKNVVNAIKSIPFGIKILSIVILIIMIVLIIISIIIVEESKQKYELYDGTNLLDIYIILYKA